MTVLFIHFLLLVFPFVPQPNISHTNVSLMVEDISNEVVLDTFRHLQVGVPASVLKLFTTGAALETLGADFRFSTFIEYSGRIEKDTLEGNIYIRGNCDPTLGSRVSSPLKFDTWVRKIKLAGIHYVRGAIIADMSLLDGEAYNPSWLFEDVGNYYAPGIYAINYLSNTMNIVLKSSEDGSIAQVIKTEPQYDSITFINQIRCSRSTSYDGAFVHSLPYCNLRYLSGSIPAHMGTFGIKGDLPNPGLLLAKHLSERLNRSGVLVRDVPSYITKEPVQLREQKESRKIIFTHLSDSLGAIIAEINTNSNNLYSEALFRYLGTLGGKTGTIKRSCDFVRGFWKKRGIDVNEMVIKDGCGLAPQNAVSSHSILGVLKYMSRSPYSSVWYSSFSVCGKTGTLEPFFKNTPLEGITIAKSGTICSTRNMAGYIKIPDGRLWAFAVLINGTGDKARKLQKHINEYLLNVYKRNL